MENNQTQLLNEEDFEKLKQKGLTDEEIANLKDALDIVDLGNQLPDDVTELLNKIENYFPKDNVGQTVDMFMQLPEKDPEFFRQIISLQAFLGTIDSPIEETHVGDALRQINEAETADDKAALTSELFTRIKKLNPESKAVFLSEMQSLSVDEKKQLLDILNKK